MERCQGVYTVSQIFHAYVVKREGVVRYVGVTTRGVERRWNHGHRQPGGKTRTALKDAIRKYGKDAFTVEHVACAWDTESLSDLERILIDQYGTLSPEGYNLKGGGFIGIVYSDEIRARISAGKVGKKHTPEHRAINSAAQMGKKMETAAIEKMRARMTGVPMAEATKEKLRAAHSGKTLSEEHKQKLRKSKNTTPRAPRSAETRAKIGDANRGREKSPETVAKLKAAALRRWHPDQMELLPGIAGQ